METMPGVKLNGTKESACRPGRGKGRRFFAGQKLEKTAGFSALCRKTVEKLREAWRISVRDIFLFAEKRGKIKPDMSIIRLIPQGFEK